MKKHLALLLTVWMLSSVLVSYISAGSVNPVDSSDTFDATPSGNDDYTVTLVVNKKPYECELVAQYDGYNVTLGEPIVVYQGIEGDNSWGHVQFPGVAYTAEGYLRVGWFYGSDTVGGTSTSYYRVSKDGGKSWLPVSTDYSTAAPSMMMKNGKCWAGFVGGGSPNGTALLAQIPDSEKLTLASGHQLIPASALEENDLAREMNLTGLSMREYDPETGTYETIECTLNWPYAAVTVYPTGYIYSVGGWFQLSGTNVIVASDGTLYTCIYAHGYNAEAATLEEAATEYTRMGKYYTYVFASEDCGRTWNYRAQFFCGDEVEGWENMECYCEPKMIEMPDGSLFMLMRTDNTTPMYSTVSHDKGYTWSTPEQFNYCGVLPQLLRLDCGVTIASYGRPDLFVTVTNDLTGDTWERHIRVPLAAPYGTYFPNKSCFYTSLLPIDENSAWFCYSDFKYPNEDGEPVKSIILRKITVTFDE